MNSWSKNGVLEKVFAGLQTEGIIEIKVQIVSIDSTIVKVHPDACGALKKKENKQSEGAEVESPPKFIWLPRLQSQP